MGTTVKMLKYDFPDTDRIEVFGISDMHIGHEGFNEGEFEKFKKFILSDSRHYVVLLGDLIDNQIKSSVGSPFEATMSPSKQRKCAGELLSDLADRTLGGVRGNHCEKSVKDTDTDPFELIMEHMGISERYRRDELYINISVGHRKSHSVTPPKYCICAVHGKGGGKTAGAGLTTADWMAASSGADLFMMGHTHKPSMFAGGRMVYDAGKNVMVQRPYQILICTAWLDYVGYGVRNMYRPTPITMSRATLYGDVHSIETHNRTF